MLVLHASLVAGALLAACASSAPVSAVPQVPPRTCAAETLAAARDVQEIVVDANSVYWTEQHGAQGLAQDDDYVYWTTLHGGQVMRRSKITGVATVVASDQHDPWAVAVDDSAVYWTTINGTPDASRRWHNVVMRWTKATGRLDEFAAGGDWGAIAVDRTHVYWTNRSKIGVERQRKTSGKAVVLDRESVGGWHIALDATHVYWTDEYDGDVRRVAKTGGPVETLALGRRAGSVAVDETHVYWTDFDKIRRRPKRGGAIEIVASEVAQPIAVTGDAIYWATGDAIRRLERGPCGL